MWLEPMERADNGDEIRVVLNLRGIGDVVVLAYAVAWLREHRPERRIVWDVMHQVVPWAKLFLDAHQVVSHERPQAHIGPVGKSVAAMPTRYHINERFTRHHQYARKVGAQPKLPRHVQPPPFDWSKVNLDRPAVVIVPQSTGQNRMWPEQKWAQLAAMLERDGVPVLALTDAEWGRCYKAQNPLDMLSLLASAPLVISNDTGPAHLAGMLGKYLITLNGIENGPGVFGFYPRARSVQGKPVGGQQCSPCVRASRYGFGTLCEGWCEALSLISAEEVYAEAVSILSCEVMPCAVLE